MIRFTYIAAALASAAASLLPALPASAEHAAAGSAGAAARQANPSDPRATVAPLDYRSAFSGYRPLADDKVGWKQANDEVGRIGGWRTYAREANTPEPAASAPAAPARTAPERPAGPAGDTPAPTTGGGHGNHKQN